MTRRQGHKVIRLVRETGSKNTFESTSIGRFKLKTLNVIFLKWFQKKWGRLKILTRCVLKFKLKKFFSKI